MGGTEETERLESSTLSKDEAGQPSFRPRGALGQGTRHQPGYRHRYVGSVTNRCAVCQGCHPTFEPHRDVRGTDGSRFGDTE